MDLSLVKNMALEQQIIEMLSIHKKNYGVDVWGLSNLHIIQLS